MKQDNTRLAIGSFVRGEKDLPDVHLVEIPEPADTQGEGARPECGAGIPPGASFQWQAWGIKYDAITCCKCREIAWKMVNPVWMLQATRHIADELHLEPQQERRVVEIIRWHALGRLEIYGLQ